MSVKKGVPVPPFREEVAQFAKVLSEFAFNTARSDGKLSAGEVAQALLISGTVAAVETGDAEKHSGVGLVLLTVVSAMVGLGEGSAIRQWVGRAALEAGPETLIKILGAAGAQVATVAVKAEDDDDEGEDSDDDGEFPWKR